MNGTSLAAQQADWNPEMNPHQSRTRHEEAADHSDSRSHRLLDRELQSSPPRKSAVPVKRDVGESVNSFEEFLKSKNLFDMSLNALFEDKPGSVEKKEPATDAQQRSDPSKPDEERKPLPKLCTSRNFESRLTKNAIEYFKKKRNTNEQSKKLKHSSNLTESRSLRHDYSGLHKPGRPSPSISKASDKSCLKSQPDAFAPKLASHPTHRATSKDSEQPLQFTSVRHEDGSVYTGFLRNKQRQGPGLLKLQDGSKYEGDWEAGKMAGQGTLTYADGRTAYTGGFLDNKPNGLGVLHSSAPQTSAPRKKVDCRDFSDTQLDWAVYEGLFLEGKKQGLGKLVFRNGDLFVGHFEDDRICGLGKFVSSSDTVLGFWANDILIRRLN